MTNTKNSRRPHEQVILESAQKIFEDAFGAFHLLNHVYDSPDAAIISETGESIGIEITTLDDQTYFKHQNSEEKKMRRKFQSKEFNHENGRHFSTRYHILPDQLAKGICLRKNIKISAYRKNNAFNEYALLLHTRIIDFQDHPQSTFLRSHFLYALECGLRRHHLQYDHAFLIHEYSKQGALVFNKKKKIHTRPLNFLAHDWRRGSYYIDETRGIFESNKSFNFSIEPNPAKIIFPGAEQGYKKKL